VPGGDHAPYYYAKKLGWYAQAGIDLNLEPGKGSRWRPRRWARAPTRWASPTWPAPWWPWARGPRWSPCTTFMPIRRRHVLAEELGHQVRERPGGKKIGNPRATVRASCGRPSPRRRHRPEIVTWVNIDATASSPGSVQSDRRHTSFYNLHHVFCARTRRRPGLSRWKDAGLNPYGNSVLINADYLRKNRAVVASFVKVTQRAFAACVATPRPACRRWWMPPAR